MDNFIRIIKSVEISAVLIDGVSKTIGNKTKKEASGLLGALITPLSTSMSRSMITGRGVVRKGRGAVKAESAYNHMDDMDKNFEVHSILKAISA